MPRENGCVGVRYERILELASDFQEPVTAVFGDYRRSTATAATFPLMSYKPSEFARPGLGC